MEETRTNRLEIMAVIATALLHPVFVDVLHQRAVFIALALIGWASYITLRVWRGKNTLQKWGFRKQGLVAAFVATSVFSVAALVMMGVIAQARQSLVAERSQTCRGNPTKQTLPALTSG
jgi:hypothetical protein